MNELIQLSAGRAAVIALLGYVVTFVGPLLLILVTWLTGKLVRRSESRRAAALAAPPVPASAAPSAPSKPSGSGVGEVELNGIDPRDAAVVMAIVAYKTGKPLETLRFHSIKEVKKS